MNLKNMYRSGIGAIAAAACVMAAFVYAGANGNDVSVSISMDKRALIASEDVVVNVTMTNNSSSVQRVLKWYTPFQEAAGPLFNVTRDGQKVRYLGAIYKRGAPTASDYMVLKPGESVKKKVEISGLYDMSITGDYAIQYHTSSAHMFGNGASGIQSSDASSVEDNAASSNQGMFTQVQTPEMLSPILAVWIDGRHARGTVAPEVASNSMAPAGVSFSQCSSSQISTITSAVNAAKTMANGSSAYMAAGSAGARYVTWFGAYSSTRFSTVKNNYTRIADALNYKPVVVDCSCRQSYYAYVYPNQPYKIYVCNAFWSAPMTGTDSKGGTLIHELSHFDIVANTDDIVYGQSGSKSLARTSPASAIRNADSHEYFSENTPRL